MRAKFENLSYEGGKAQCCAAKAEAQGITNFINVKSNVLETLKDYLKKLGI